MAPKPKTSAAKGTTEAKGTTSAKSAASASKVTKSKPAAKAKAAGAAATTSKAAPKTTAKATAAKAAATKAATTKAAATKAAAAKAAASDKKQTTEKKPAVEKKPVTEKKPAKKPAAEKKATTARKPAKRAVAAKKSAAEDTAAEKPTVEDSTTEKPAAKKSAKNVNGKRPLDDEDGENDAGSAAAPVATAARPKKKARVTVVKEVLTGWRRQVMLKRQKKPGVQNSVPSTPLDVFVFGEGTAGELGLGSTKHEGKRPIDVKRPRLNHNLDAAKVGVVDIACGGMHAIALTKDNRVLTWGVNDDKALGRDTTWSGGIRDADKEDSDSDDDDDDTGLNPLETTPTQIQDGELTSSDIICKVAACDSASFILTTDGFVYGWGTFRGADGIIGFSEGVKVQATPVLIEPLQDITNIVCGSNHVIALDVNGKVWTWGSGGQFQLGRKPVTRLGGPSATLRPQPCGMFGKRHHAVSIGAGSYHSFYIDNQQRVWAWGLNNYSQTGHSDDTGEDDAMVLQPKVVNSLKESNILSISGGEHHSVARTEDGKLLTWGRVDGHQVGQPSDLFNEDNAVFDENKRPRILLQPTQVPNINTKFIATGTDTSFAIDTNGRLYSWGFSANYQTGQGTTDDIEVPTVIDNSAIRDRDMVWAGAGGQYSMAAAEHVAKDSSKVNGN